MQKRLVQSLLAACLVAAAVTAGVWLTRPVTDDHPSGAHRSESEAAGVPVRVRAAEQRTLAMVVHGLGKCEARPRKAASLTSAIEGRVIQLSANPGDSVKAGQTIVELDTTVAAAALAEKEAMRDGAEASLRLLESLPRPEEQQASRLAIDEAKLVASKAQANVERLRPLRQRNEIPEAQMYEAELALQLAAVQQQSAQSQLDALMLKPRPEAIAQAKIQIAAAEAAVASAKAQLDLHAIRSPIDGVLDSLVCRLGQTLSVGSPVGEVVDPSQLDVVVWLPVAELLAVRPGQKARIARDDDPANQSQDGAGPHPQPPVVGEVTFIGRVADPQTGNLPVRIAVDNTAGRLTLGEVLGADITVLQHEVLAVPAAAVEDLGEGPVLNVVRDGKSVPLRPRLGLRDEAWVEILDTDLAPGEAVIVEGGYNLPEGTELASDTAESADSAAPARQQGGEEPKAAGSPGENAAQGARP